MLKYKKGKIVKGIVSGITNYGIFVSLEEYYSGLIHISEISNLFVRNVNDFAKIGEEIYVKILDVNEDENQLKLSIKDINYKVNTNKRKKKIRETTHGFHTLEYKLPIWIDEGLKKYNCEIHFDGQKN